jgi:hypothetical protein
MRLIIFFTIQIISIFWVLNITYAQDDFREGYVITKTNDTIIGYLKYTSYGSNTCVFKKSLADEEIEFSTSEITSFKYNDGKYFIGKEVNIGNGMHYYFLEYLFKGRLNIYFIRFDGVHYFMEKENEEMIELTEKDSIISVNINGAVKQVLMKKRTKGKLKYYLSDCPALFGEIDNLNTLTYSGLIKLAKDYQDKTCKSEQYIVFETQIKPIKLKMGVFAGASINSFNFGRRLVTDPGLGFNIGYRFEINNLINWSEYTSVTGDISIHWFSVYTLNQNDDLRNTVHYNGKTYQLDYISSLGDISYETIRNLKVNINSIAIGLPLLINQYFYIKKTQTYVGGGIENMFFLKQNKDFIYDKFYDWYGKSIPIYQIGGILRAGVKYELKKNNSIGFELNYIYAQNIALYRSTALTNNLFNLSLCYGF